MSCHSKPFDQIQPFDVFYGLKYNEFGNKMPHYYVCIYTQKEDKNNSLVSDVYGLLVTTNPKYQHIPNDYFVSAQIYGKKAFICCDKIERFVLTDEIEIKGIKLPQMVIDSILYRFKKFTNEVYRQMENGGNKDGNNY
jgi:hypothetical protein